MSRRRSRDDEINTRITFSLLSIVEQILSRDRRTFCSNSYERTYI